MWRTLKTYKRQLSSLWMRMQTSLCVLCAKSLQSCLTLHPTLWTIVCPGLCSKFSRPEYWVVACPLWRIFLEDQAWFSYMSPALWGGFHTTKAPGKPSHKSKDIIFRPMLATRAVPLTSCMEGLGYKPLIRESCCKLPGMSHESVATQLHDLMRTTDIWNNQLARYALVTKLWDHLWTEYQLGFPATPPPYKISSPPQAMIVMLSPPLQSLHTKCCLNS